MSIEVSKLGGRSVRPHLFGEVSEFRGRCPMTWWADGALPTIKEPISTAASFFSQITNHPHPRHPNRRCSDRRHPSHRRPSHRCSNRRCSIGRCSNRYCSNRRSNSTAAEAAERGN